MNQIDVLGSQGSMEDAHTRLITPHDAAHWSADDFALVIGVSRRPATFASGLSPSAEDQISLPLDVALSPHSHPVATQALLIGEDIIQVQMDAVALDALAQQLDAKSAPDGAGRTLSLDAIEALWAAMFCHVPQIGVGAAAWVDGAHGKDLISPMVLHLFNAKMPLAGKHSTVRMLHQTALAGRDGLLHDQQPAQNDVLSALAIRRETLLGITHLSDQDIASLEPGCGVSIDTLWPHGRPVFARRFAPYATDGQQWQLVNELEANTALVLRSNERLCTLDDPILASDGTGRVPSHVTSYAEPQAQSLVELLRGDDVLASGKLMAAQNDGQSILLFQVDDLAG